MSLEQYMQAYKKGKKEYRSRLLKGLCPTPEILDNILPERGSYSEMPVGLVSIPLDLIGGTVTEGRSTSFAANFMPVLDPNSEFASKWGTLCDSHEREGIREAIKAYEYLHRFYVLEGNKRVSVLKFYDAVSIVGNVTRILPHRTPENELYFEFIDFYDKTQLYEVEMTQKGSYRKLLTAVKGNDTDQWTDDDRMDFQSVYNIFTREYKLQIGNEEKKSGYTNADAFLSLLSIYSYAELMDKTPDQMKELVKNAKEEFIMSAANPKNQEVEIKTDPGVDKKSLFSKMLPAGNQKIKAAFIYEKTADTSAWTYMHELGRIHLEQTFPHEVSTVSYDQVTTENIDSVIQDAVDQKCGIIFTTTPIFASASVKAAIEHPEVKILNCSLNTSHRYIRTYYTRMHEVKFLMGIIAGILADNDTICYFEDYPIYGSIVSINAFAMGVGMVNPRAKIYLEWTSKKDADISQMIDELSPSVISGNDMLFPQKDSRLHGIYRIKNGKLQNVAMPLLHWGRFYEKLIRTILDGNWKADDDSGTKKAINYWWGISADVVDLICSGKLPVKTKRLIDSLRRDICQKELSPFAGALFSQTGQIQGEEAGELSIDELVKMDWLADNVIGSIPSREQLEEHAKPVVEQSGVPGTEKIKGEN